MEVTLKNQDIKVCLSSTGAAIRSIDVALSDYTFRRITLCFAKEEPWHQNPFYSGSTLAPTAGRIKNGYLPIGSKTYTLTKNENGLTHIHGGFHNLSFCQWEIADFHPNQSITFRTSLPDGIDGYPGNRTFFVTYRLTGRWLSISQYAKTDHTTYINMSNHTYFNLNGFHTSGLNQYLKIEAAQVIINDENHLPVKTIDTRGTEFDFSDFKLLGEQIRYFKDIDQIILSRGYNHCFLLSGSTGQAPTSYSLMSGDQKLTIDFYTDAPGVVLYTGGFLEDRFLLSKSAESTCFSGPGCAVALEPCFPPCYPDDHDNMSFHVTEREFHREISFHIKG